MTVFKTMLKIINKIKGLLIMYTCILISVTITTQTTGSSNNMEFKDSKPAISIINNDKETGVTKGLISYLEKNTDVKELNLDKKDAINDAIFYRDVSFILYIPENFNNDVVNGITPKFEYKGTEDYYASYTKMLIEKYLKIALIYKDYYTGDELITKINSAIDQEVNIKIDSTLDTDALASTTRYFNYLNYSLLAGCVYCISFVLASVKNKDVYKRTIISSYDYKKYNFIVLFSNFLVVLFIWLLYIGLSFILFKDTMLSLNGLYFIFNSFIYMLCTLSIGYLIGSITQNKTAIGGIVNVVALGTSFLCGAFVPMEYMPESVINIAKIMPTYYYTHGNELVRYFEVFNFDTLKPLFTNMVIIIIYSLFFIILTILIVNKKKKIN